MRVFWFWQSSPPPLCAAGRTADLAALLGAIDAAAEFIDVAVMSYLPTTEFSRPERFVLPAFAGILGAIEKRRGDDAASAGAGGEGLV